MCWLLMSSAKDAKQMAQVKCVFSYIHINLSNNHEFEYTKVYDYYINDGAYGSFRHEYRRLFTPKVLKVVEMPTIC